MYVYIQFAVRNEQAFTQYAQAVGATVQRYNGETVAVNRSPQPLHGNAVADVCVIQKWPSLEAVQGWLNSPEYAPLKKLRDEAAMGDLLIMPVPDPA